MIPFRAKRNWGFKKKSLQLYCKPAYNSPQSVPAPHLCPTSTSPLLLQRQLQEQGEDSEVLPASRHSAALSPPWRVPVPEEGPLPRALSSSATPRSCSYGLPVSMWSPFPRELDQNQRCLRKLRMSCQGLAGAQRKTALWHLRLRREHSISKAGSNSASRKAPRDAEERPSHRLTKRCQQTGLMQALPCPYLDGSTSGQARLLLSDLPPFLILSLVQIQDIPFLHPLLPFLPEKRVKNVTESCSAPTTHSREEGKGTTHLRSPHPLNPPLHTGKESSEKLHFRTVYFL